MTNHETRTLVTIVAVRAAWSWSVRRRHDLPGRFSRSAHAQQAARRAAADLPQRHPPGRADGERQGQGRASIEGLTAKDFIVTEDGQPQDIAFVEFQRLLGRRPRRPTHAGRDSAGAPRPLRRPHRHRR